MGKEAKEKYERDKRRGQVRREKEKRERREAGAREMVPPLPSSEAPTYHALYPISAAPTTL